MTLTAEERDKFALYLEQDVAEKERVIAKLVNAPSLSTIAVDMQRIADAERIVARKLRCGP